VHGAASLSVLTGWCAVFQVEDKERKVAFITICVTIFLSGFLYTYLIPLVPSYHLITGAYFSTAEVALLFASYSFGKALC
jgi:hypothetical protein